MLLATPALSQIADDGTGTLGALLNQLQALQEGGALGAFTGGPTRSPLDTAREGNQRRLEQLQPQEDSDTTRQSSAFATERMELFEQLCRGDVPEDQARLVRAIADISAVEEDYCLRISQPIEQFGYDLVGQQGDIEALDVGAISDEYVVGIDDGFVITFHGQDNRTLTVRVDREGRLLIPEWQPILAAGRRFGEIRREIEIRTATTKLGTEVFVSLGAVRAVSVFVLGEVKRPGRHQATALSTIFDAIGRAGGVAKTGSLRRIQLQRGNEITWIDAYELLHAGLAARDMLLRDGDRIIVPTLGPTVAVTGDVRRQAIYELAEGERSISVAGLLDMSGGTIRPRGNRFVHVSFAEDGSQLVVEHDNFAARVADGDIIQVARRRNVQLGGVFLEGHVRVPGRRSMNSVASVAELLGDANSLKDDPYLPFAALETVDPETKSRRLFPLNLQRLLNGEDDYALRDGDRLVVLGAEDIRFLISADVQDIVTGRVEERSARLVRLADVADTTQVQGGQTTESSTTGVQNDALSAIRGLLGQQQVASGATGTDQQPTATQRRIDLVDQQNRIRACPGLLRLTNIMADESIDRFDSALVTLGATNELRALDVRPCPRVFERFPDLLPLALEHVIAVNGAIREPGLYPVAGETAITTVIAVGGGLVRDVDLTRVEVSRHIPDSLGGDSQMSRGMVDLASVGADNVMVAAGDVIRFNAVFTDRDSGPVLIAGEFVRPGRYEIRRGERLSEVMQRAGGLTPQAYPYGAIFTRESVRLTQEIGLRRAARELQSAIAVAAVQRGIDPAAVLSVQQVAQQLDTVEALGRVVIEADPTVLQVRPELDPVLEPGDRIFMPKRPNFVSVIGDVLNPGAMQFIAGTSADRYISQAGGFQKSADEDRIFIVYPNGAAQPLTVSVWNFQVVQVPPGSSIVVPKDPAPLDLLTLVREGTQVVGQLAIAAASLAVISRN